MNTSELLKLIEQAEEEFMREHEQKTAELNEDAMLIAEKIEEALRCQKQVKH